MTRFCLDLCARCVVPFLLFCGIAPLSLAQDQSWLQSHHFETSHPDRYEGLLPHHDAMLEYDILAFLVEDKSKDTNLDQNKSFQTMPARLGILFCQPPAEPGNSSSRTAFIGVRYLSPRYNYLMKTAVDPGMQVPVGHWHEFDWPTQDVIQKNGLDANMLGPVIHRGEDSIYADDLIPAYFSTGSASAPADVEDYRLVMRIHQFGLESLRYKIVAANGKARECFYKDDHEPCAATKQPARLIEKDSLVRLRLNMTDLPAGRINVDIEGRHYNEEGSLKVRFHFEHQPKCQ